MHGYWLDKKIEELNTSDDRKVKMRGMSAIFHQLCAGGLLNAFTFFKDFDNYKKSKTPKVTYF